MPIYKDNITTIMHDEFIPYAGESIINFLPSIDGVLPVHRKVAIAMLRNHRTHNNPYTKTIKVMGEIVSYYVFGDMPLYQAMVNMANNGMNIPYVDGKGSWGDKFREDGEPASARYTDCRATQYMMDMMHGLNKNNVPMKSNYDNTSTEMIVMPSLPPNILLNTSQSISVSEASKIPSHNVNDCCSSLIHYIKTNDIDTSIDILQCPDFSSGGQIVKNVELFREIYKTGKGSFILIGKYKYDKDDNVVSIYEVPYETTIDAIESKIREHYEKNNFKEIADIRNATGRNGIRLDIYLKKNTDIDTFIAKLRKYTPFESKLSCNFTILDLDWKTPVLVNLQGIYDRWITHRINCICNEIMYDIKEKTDSLNLLNGLNKVLLDIDKAISIIKNSTTDAEVIKGLMNAFDLDEIQANYVADIKIRNLNKEYILNKTKNIMQLSKEIKKLKETVSDTNKIKQIIIEQLQDVINKYGKPRLTEIVEDIDKMVVVDTIADYNAMFYITKENYLKKIPLTSLRSSGEHRLKDGDSIIEEINGNNLSEILIFTNKAVCYKVRAYELSDSKTSMLGDYLPTLLGLDKDERILKVVVTSEFSGYMLFAYANGKIAKIEAKAYETIQKRTKLVNAYNTDSPLVGIMHITEDIDVLCRSDISKILIFNTSQINSKATKNSMGIQALKSKNDSKMDLCVPLSKVEGLDKAIDYYRGTAGAIGCFLRKTDVIKIVE